MEKELKPILIITYYWPPSGGAGVQRWLKFSKYLPENGWRPIIFTPENPDFDLKDESLIKDVHSELEVLKFPIWEPYRIFKKLSGQKELRQGQILEDSKKGWFKNLAVWLRGNLFIPDPRVFWVKPSVKYLSDILKTNQIKHVITTGPPHSMHLIGLKLKMQVPSLTWVADFRDPWTKWEILHEMKISKPVWKKHNRLEQAVFKASTSLLVTSPSAAKEFKELGARRVKVITNGFDEDDYEIESQEGSNEFVISHVGMLSNQRNPKALWTALSELVDNNPDRKLKLKLTGIISQDALNAIENHPQLKSILEISESVPHQEVSEIYAKSDLLLLIQTKTDRKQTQLPGKLFEYLQAGKPILCVGDSTSDLSEILEETNAGKCFEYSDQENMLKFLQEAVNDNLILSFKNIEKYTRHNLTKNLSNWLEKL